MLPKIITDFINNDLLSHNNTLTTLPQKIQALIENNKDINRARQWLTDLNAIREREKNKFLDYSNNQRALSIQPSPMASIVGVAAAGMAYGLYGAFSCKKEDVNCDPLLNFMENSFYGVTVAVGIPIAMMLLNFLKTLVDFNDYLGKFNVANSKLYRLKLVDEAVQNSITQLEQANIERRRHRR